MKNHYFFSAFLLFLVFTHNLTAQPSFYFYPTGTVTVDEGESAQFEVHTRDFTQLLQVQFVITWDPAVAELETVTDFNPDLNLDVDAFEIDNVNGKCHFSMVPEVDFDCYVPEYTLPDSTSLFTLNFSTVEGVTDLAFTEDHNDRFITRTNACPVDIGCFFGPPSQLVVEVLFSGIDSEARESNQVILYPNPATDFLYWNLATTQVAPDQLRILDYSGRELLRRDAPQSNQLDVSQLPAGLYFLEFSWNKQSRILQPFVVR